MCLRRTTVWCAHFEAPTSRRSRPHRRRTRTHSSLLGRLRHREGLRTLSDLARAAPHLSFGGPPECPSRRECLAGLRRVYGAKFKEFVELDAGGPVTRQALDQGYVDVALLFTTDPSIARGDLVELVDDRGLQPAENVIPLIRTELRARFGARLVRILDGVSRGLTTEALGRLNGEVEAGAEPARVAARWLRTELRP